MSETKISKPQPQARSAYTVFRSFATRWMDSDVYGHVNNIVYYSWFDTAVNAFLIERGALDLHAYVGRQTRRPLPPPLKLKTILEALA